MTRTAPFLAFLGVLGACAALDTQEEAIARQTSLKLDTLFERGCDDVASPLFLDWDDADGDKIKLMVLDEKLDAALRDCPG